MMRRRNQNSKGERLRDMGDTKCAKRKEVGVKKAWNEPSSPQKPGNGKTSLQSSWFEGERKAGETKKTTKGKTATNHSLGKGHKQERKKRLRGQPTEKAGTTTVR